MEQLLQLLRGVQSTSSVIPQIIAQHLTCGKDIGISFTWDILKFVKALDE